MAFYMRDLPSRDFYPNNLDIFTNGTAEAPEAKSIFFGSRCRDWQLTWKAFNLPLVLLCQLDWGRIKSLWRTSVMCSLNLSLMSLRGVSGIPKIRTVAPRLELSLVLNTVDGEKVETMTQQWTESFDEWGNSRPTKSKLHRMRGSLTWEMGYRCTGVIANRWGGLKGRECIAWKVEKEGRITTSL